MREQQLLRRALNINFSRLQTLDLAFLALFIVFTSVATALAIPGPYGSYFNLGEVAIFLVALLCGPIPGALAGAVGSAMTDMFLGYTIWAPFTFVIKGVEGYIVGRLGRPLGFKRSLLAIVIGGLWMIFGYGTTIAFLYGWPAVIPEVLIDIAQVSIGAIIALPLAFKVHRALKLEKEL